MATVRLEGFFIAFCVMSEEMTTEHPHLGHQKNEARKQQERSSALGPCTLAKILREHPFSSDEQGQSHSR